MEVQHSPFCGRSSAGDDMEAKAQDLQCPVCADSFTDPVLLPCGHNFCQACIRIVWNMDDSDVASGPLFCPECQIFLPSELKLEINTDLQRNLRNANTCTNGHGPVLDETPLTSPLSIMCDHCIERSSVAVKSCLTCDASLCSAHTLHHQQRDLLRGHRLMEVTEDLLSYKCREHGEELKLFCQEDEAVVCCLCVVLGTHKNHTVVQLEEACLDFKKALQQREAQLLQRKDAAESEMQKLDPLFSEFLGSTEACKVKIAEKYQQMKALIDKDQQLMMDILESEVIYTNKWLESKKESLECHIQNMNALTSEYKSILHENNNLKFLQLLKKHQYSHRTKIVLAPLPSVETEHHTTQRTETVLRLADSLYEAITQNTQRLWANLRAIHLDAETAHPKLEVSSDMLEVHWSKKTNQDSAESEKLCSEYSVLTRESFSYGTHYWEVAVWEKPYWLIGLSYGSNALSDVCSSLNKAFCYLYHGNGKYLVCSGSKDIVLPVGKKIQKLGVCVDFQRGTVSFYNADMLKLLHSFAVEFVGPVKPLLNPCVDLNEQNTQSLFLFNLRNQKKVTYK